MANSTDLNELVPNSPDLEAIRSNPDEAMVQIYRQHREAFVRWAAGRTNLGEHDIADVFQDCVIILLKNIRSGRLNQLSASLRTYIFGIGKNLLSERMRSSAKLDLPGDEKLVLPADFDPGAEHQMVLSEEEQQIRTALARLGDPCHRLLTLAFYETMKGAAIAAAMGYASEEVVRTQKKRCLEKLRTLFIKK